MAKVRMFILKCKPEDPARMCNGYDTRTSVRVKPVWSNAERNTATSCAMSAHHLRKLPRDGKTEARYTVLP